MMLPEFSSQREKEKFFRTLNGEQKIDALNEIIEESKHIVFLGGAGVSTESGIPDFRSKDGLYNKKDSKFRKYLVILNKGKTKMEGRADLVFHDSIGKVMSQIR